MDEAHTRTHTHNCEIRSKLDLDVVECFTHVCKVKIALNFFCSNRTKEKPKKTEKCGTKESNALKVASCQRERIMVNLSCLAAIIAIEHEDYYGCLFVFLFSSLFPVGKISDRHIEIRFMSEHCLYWAIFIDFLLCSKQGFNANQNRISITRNQCLQIL